LPEKYQSKIDSYLAGSVTWPAQEFSTTQAVKPLKNCLSKQSAFIKQGFISWPSHKKNLRFKPKMARISCSDYWYSGRRLGHDSPALLPQ
jgi:hypothetical protein